MDVMEFMATAHARSPLTQVSSSTLHRETRQTLDLLHDTGEVMVTYYNRVEGVLVSPERYEALTSAARQGGDALGNLPVLAAAVAARVAIPSETLDRMFPGRAPFDWRQVAEFASRFPMALSGDEDGDSLTHARLSPATRRYGELGTDDELNLD